MTIPSDCRKTLSTKTTKRTSLKNFRIFEHKTTDKKVGVEGL
jgi:hypothetical protein